MKNLVLNSNWWTLWPTYHFYQRRINVFSYQEGIHCCTANKYSTETVITASLEKGTQGDCFVCLP